MTISAITSPTSTVTRRVQIDSAASEAEVKNRFILLTKLAKEQPNKPLMEVFKISVLVGLIIGQLSSLRDVGNLFRTCRLLRLQGWPKAFPDFTPNPSHFSAVSGVVQRNLGLQPVEKSLSEWVPQYIEDICLFWVCLSTEIKQDIPQDQWGNFKKTGDKTDFRRWMSDHVVELSKIKKLQIPKEGDKLHHLPSEIGLLVNLKSLILANNKLSSLPSAITKLSHLREIDLQCNRFNRFPKEVFHMQELTYLNINNNFLSEMPEDISNLKNLTYLLVNNNQIRTLPPRLIELSKLVELNISHNPLSHFPEEFVGLPNRVNLYCFGLSKDRFPGYPGLSKEQFPDYNKFPHLFFDGADGVNNIGHFVHATGETTLLP